MSKGTVDVPCLCEPWVLRLHLCPILDAAAAQADYGKTVSTTAADPSGSSTSGQSNKKLDHGNIHATNNQFRLHRSAEDPENDDNAANRSVVVCQNLNQYMQNTGTAGITWQ